jgi:hypothetical protein
MFAKAQRVRRHFKVALFGKWKTGKTRAALSFPAPAVIDTHRGTDLYDQKYDFSVEYVTTWKEMEPRIVWLQKNAAEAKVETLVIDDISTIYDDLIGEVSLWRQNKSGSNAPLSQGDWGIIKRRWKGFLQMLLRLDLNVVLVIREKDEYEETTNAAGQDVRKKTGNTLMDADRQTAYLFDFILYMYCEDNPKKKTSTHLVRVEGTRHNRLPKYSVHDITGKRMYAEMFEPIRGEVEQGLPVPQEEEKPVVTHDPPPADAPSDPPPEEAPIPPPKTDVTMIGEIRNFFGTITPDQPEATLEDIKVLMSRANDMQWPDHDHKCRKQGCKANGHVHPNFKSSDGKSLIRSVYGVESSKELRKPQIDFLYGEFGKVLSGLAYLDWDKEGSPYVATPPGKTEEEVRKAVLTDW